METKIKIKATNRGDFCKNLPVKWTVNPDTKEITFKTDDLPNFDQVVTTLPLDPWENIMIL